MAINLTRELSGVLRLMTDKEHVLDYEEHRKLVVDLETMIGDFRRTADELDQQIRIEQEASGITDVNHYAYPTFARAAIQRRNNLRASITELEGRLGRARTELAEALEQIKITETAAGLEAQRQLRSTVGRRPLRALSTVSEG
jgi:flagellar protein FliJ